MKRFPVIMSKSMVLGIQREAAEPGTGKHVTRRNAWLEDGLTATSWQKLQPGDLLWVKEGIDIAKDGFRYSADGAKVASAVSIKLRDEERKRGKPYVNLGGRYVPRFSTRFTLEVTHVGLERLQDITDEGALAEGVALNNWAPVPDIYWVPGLEGAFNAPTPKLMFKNLWSRLHGNDAWDLNPEVVPISFKVHAENVDALGARAA